MLWTEVLNCKAISRQVSSSLTVYSMGGSGVQVGRGVTVAVLLGVVVKVGVIVTVVSELADSSTVELPPVMIKKINKPIKTRITTMIAINAIRFNLISGIRVEEILSSVFLDFGAEDSLTFVKSVPQTRHLRAFSESLVPHTGQFLLLFAGIFG